MEVLPCTVYMQDEIHFVIVTVLISIRFEPLLLITELMTGRWRPHLVLLDISTP